VKRRWFAAIFLAAVAIVLLGLWLARAFIAVRFARSYFNSHGIHSNVEIGDLGFAGLSGRFALGSEGAPEISADRIELRFDPLRWLPYVVEVRLIHPVVRDMRDQFVEHHAAAPIILFDIPLLLETGVQVDAVVVASAPEHVQKARVLARPGMTEEKFTALAARQLSDAQKRAQAHYVVMTDQGLDHAREQVKMILADIRHKIDA